MGPGVGPGAGPGAVLLAAAGRREGPEGLAGLQEGVVCSLGSPEEGGREMEVREGEAGWECMTALAAFTSLPVPCYKHTHTHTPHTHVTIMSSYTCNCTVSMMDDSAAATTYSSRLCQHVHVVSHCGVKLPFCCRAYMVLTYKTVTITIE